MKPTYWISHIYDPSNEFILFLYNMLLAPKHHFFYIEKKIQFSLQRTVEYQSSYHLKSLIFITFRINSI
jgi:hypothetical protein